MERGDPNLGHELRHLVTIEGVQHGAVHVDRHFCPANNERLKTVRYFQRNSHWIERLTVIGCRSSRSREDVGGCCVCLAFAGASVLELVRSARIGKVRNEIGITSETH